MMDFIRKETSNSVTTNKKDVSRKETSNSVPNKNKRRKNIIWKDMGRLDMKTNKTVGKI